MLNKTIIAACAVIIIIISGSAATAQRTVNKRKQTISKSQSVRINLTGKGYEPSSFRLKKGIPARITFIRRTADVCGEEVVIPAYNIRRKLPLNQLVTIALTPRRAGTFDFACGMDMLRGKLIVQ